MQAIYSKGIIYLVAAIYLTALMPVRALASDQPLPGMLKVATAEPFVLQPQEEGKLAVPAVPKPWYKKWWVWTIITGVAAGIAAGSSDYSESKKQPDPVIQ